MSRRPKKSDLTICDLPVASVNLTLELELEPGVVVLTRAYQVHAERRHPDDYAKCLPHLATVITNPLYIGDDFDNPDGIELVGKVPGFHEFLFVAIKLRPDEFGRYHVATFHLATQGKINSRREKNFLKPARSPPTQKA
jgi:hypothetical protein